MSTLYVPDYVAKEEEAKISSVSDAYVDQEDKVLEPSLLDKALKDRLPQPTGWRILVMPYAGKATTDGGIHIPDTTRSREALATVVAYVLRVGPLAYKDSYKFSKYGGGILNKVLMFFRLFKPHPWCEEGQWICIGRYAGSRFKIDGGEVRIINDDEIIATIIEPDDVQHV